MKAVQKYNIWFLIPLIFLAGELIIIAASGEFDARYIFLNVILAVISFYLIRRFGTFTVENFPLRLILIIIFVTYFIQFYWIIIDPQITANRWFAGLHWLAYSPEVQFNSFLTATLGFISFAAAAYLFAAKQTPTWTKTSHSNINYLYIVSILTWLIAVLMTITSYIMYATGIGRMGAETVTLSFRLAGWILYTRTTLIPGLILLLIWCSDRGGLKKYFVAGLILLLIHGISETLLTTSRGFVVILFLDLMFLLIITGKLNKYRAGFTATAAALTILLWPLFSAYRSAREIDHKVPIISSLREAAESLYAGPSTYFEESVNGMHSIFFRTGMISLFPIIGSDTEPIGTKIFKTKITEFYTNEVLGYSPNLIHSSAPSLFGWFYLLGGNAAVCIGIFLLTIIVWYFWLILSKAKLHSLPVSRTLFLGFILGVSVEGTLDRIWLHLLVLAGSIAVCEFIMRAGSKSLTIGLQNEHSIYN